MVSTTGEKGTYEPIASGLTMSCTSDPAPLANGGPTLNSGWSNDHPGFWKNMLSGIVNPDLVVYIISPIIYQDDHILICRVYDLL